MPKQVIYSFLSPPFYNYNVIIIMIIFLLYLLLDIEFVTCFIFSHSIKYITEYIMFAFAGDQHLASFRLSKLEVVPA